MSASRPTPNLRRILLAANLPAAAAAALPLAPPSAPSGNDFSEVIATLANSQGFGIILAAIEVGAKKDALPASSEA